MENKNLICIITLPILIVLTAIVFSLTEITLNSFMTTDILGILKMIFSFYGILTIIFSIITLVILTIILSQPLEKSDSIIITGIYLIGIIISGLFAPNFIFAGVFSALGILVSLKTIKKSTSFKTGKKVSGQIVLFFTIGLFITMLFVTYNNKESLEENFVEDLLISTIGDENYFKQSLEKPIIELVISTQKQTILTIKQLPGYIELNTKNDLDAIKFTNSLLEIENQINSQKYKQTLIDEMEKHDEGITLNSIKETKLIKKFSEYAWLIYSLGIFMTTLIIGSFIISNLVGFIFWIYDKTLPKTNY